MLTLYQFRVLHFAIKQCTKGRPQNDQRKWTFIFIAEFTSNNRDYVKRRPLVQGIPVFMRAESDGKIMEHLQSVVAQHKLIQTFDPNF